MRRESRQTPIKWLSEQLPFADINRSLFSTVFRRFKHKLCFYSLWSRLLVIYHVKTVKVVVCYLCSVLLNSVFDFLK